VEHRQGVFENKVLRRIFGPKRDEVTREWKKLHNEELRDLYSSPRRMRWAGHVAGMGRRATRIGCWWERDHYEGQDVGGWTILKSVRSADL
jgi:hypothetical protein